MGDANNSSQPSHRAHLTERNYEELAEDDKQQGSFAERILQSTSFLFGTMKHSMSLYDDWRSRPRKEKSLRNVTLRPSNLQDNGAIHENNEDHGMFEKEVAVLLRKSSSSSLQKNCDLWHYTTNSPDSEKVRPKAQAYTRILLCAQLENWDCGVACLQMILRWLRAITPCSFEGKDTRKVTASELSERDWMLRTIGTESIWTIDLVMLLQQQIQEEFSSSLLPPCNSVSFLFLSNKLGVDNTHSQLGYYRNAFQSDECRVNDLFHQAHNMELPIRCCAHGLAFAQVVSIVSNENCIAMALLDNSILDGNIGRSRGTQSNDTTTPNYGPIIDDTKKTTPLQGKSGSPDTYAGHYIVLCGISFNPVDIAVAEQNDNQDSQAEYCMVIKNPARYTETTFVTPALFERAWRADGTDEDIIFVAQHSSLR